MHRDIKLSNLLYTHHHHDGHGHGHLKLADFGLARKSCFHPDGDFNLTQKVVSLWYRPPELLLGCTYYDYGVDNYSAGCAIAELILGKPLIKGESEVDQLSKIFKLLGPPTSTTFPGLYSLPMVQNKTITIPSNNDSQVLLLFDRIDVLSSEGISLISNLLKYDISKRLKSCDAMKSAYFQQAPLPTDPSLMPKFPSKH